MFFHLLFIHLFRPFLKYKAATSPLPAHVSPRKLLTHAASMISKLLRLYKRTHGLRQICNIVVYISHSACTIHLLNLPDKNAARDIVHGLKHLEEIAESWLCARRTLGILHLVAKRWSIEVPEEADKTFSRTEAKFGSFKEHEVSSKAESNLPPPTPIQPLPPPAAKPSVDSSTQQSSKGSDANMSGAYTNGTHASNAPVANSVPTSDIANLNDTLRMPSQPTTEFAPKSRQHYDFPAPQMQQQRPKQQPLPQQAWNPNPPTSAPPPPTTSPTMLFGGVDSLIQDQEWWLRDSNQMFANWNGMEQDAIMHGNAGFDTGTGNLGYMAAPPYGMNGMNGNGNTNGNMRFGR